MFPPSLSTRSFGVLLGSLLAFATGAEAVSSRWTGPGSDFLTAGNWDHGVPDETATFGAAGPTNISLTSDWTLQYILFNTDTPARTLAVSGDTTHLILQGQGVTNLDSSVPQTVTSEASFIAFKNRAQITHTAFQNSNNATLQFEDSTSAGSAEITNNDISGTVFTDHSNAGTAKILNSSLPNVFGGTFFNNDSSAAGATIINDGGGTGFFDDSSASHSTILTMARGITQFSDRSTADTAMITILPTGQLSFLDQSSGGNARIINNGEVFIDELKSAGTNFGSLEGAGFVHLGSKSLTIGTNNLDTLMEGDISGDGGSLVKRGSGVLTLAGDNTYTNGTTINGGILRVGSANAIPSSSLRMANIPSAMLDLNGFDQSFHTLLGGGANGGNILLSGGTLSVGDNTTASSYGGAILGAGSFGKVGSKDLLLFGHNTFSGNMIVYEGRLVAGTANTFSKTSRLVLAGASAPVMVKLNGFDQTIGSLESVSAGGYVLVDNASLTLGVDNTSSQFNGIIGGSGSLIKSGQGTFTLISTGSVLGSTAINGGTLRLAGKLGGPVSVGSEGILSGTGQLGTLRNNGVVAPGDNGSGTMIVDSYAGPGILDIRFNGTAHGSLVVAGTANLAEGTLTISGNKFESGDYDIVTANQTTGIFSQVHTPTLPLLAFETRYNAVGVKLHVVVLEFAHLGATENQQELATALDSLPATQDAGSDIGPSTLDDETGIHGILQAVRRLTSLPQVQNAYQQMSGDALTSFQSVSLRQAALFSGQMADRTSIFRPELQASLPPIPQFAYNGDVSQMQIGAATAPTGLWARGSGSFDHTNGNSDTGSPGTDAQTGGFQAGYDYPVIDELLLGFSGGYTNTNLTVDDRSSSGDIDGIQLGVYGRYLPAPWSLKGSLGYTRNSNSMTRPIVFPGVSAEANSDFLSHVITGMLEAGYILPLDSASWLEPSFGIRQSHLKQNAFTETGAPGLNLQVEEQTQNSTLTSLGIRWDRRFVIQNTHPLTVGARAAWEHEFADTDSLITAQFADAPGTVFSVRGTPRERNSAALGLETQFRLTEQVALLASYAAILNPSETNQSLQGGIKFSW